MAGWFELSKSSDNQFRFVLKAGNGETILTSELYTSKTSAEKGIASVRSNSPQEERYEKKTASNGKFYFNLKAANHQIIGSSQMYATAQSRETGIASVKANGTSQTVKDNLPLLADISHELRTPLAVLRGELEAIQDGVRKFTPETVASLQAEVGTLTKLVDDLHQLSMSDEGALAYQKAPVDLIPLLEVAGGAFRERFASRGLKLQFSLPDSITVFGDRDRLMQLFNNLLENSLRYTDSGGSLQISAGQRDKTVRLTFADSAPGVSDDQLQKLFERFYRTEGSRNRASGGSGLGLAICLNIVEAHNGRIIAAHSPFGGVSITVELPLERDLQREV